MSHQDTDAAASTSGKPALIRLPGLLKQVQVSRPTLYRMIARGEFPKGIKLGDRMTVWNADEVDAWIRQRIEQGGAK